MKLFRVLVASALTLAAFGQTLSKPPARKTVQLPSSKLLFEPVPGDPVATNSFPGTMALSPDGRYAAILNNGRGTAESHFQQSIGIFDFQTRKLTDFPDLRFRLEAAQTIYYGLVFSSRGDEIYASVASLTDPEGLKEGNLGNGIAVYSLKNGVLTPSRFLKLPLQKIPEGHRKTEVCKKCAAGLVPVYPAGLTVLPGSPDRILVAGNLSDNVLVVDSASGAISQTFDVSTDRDVPSAFPFKVIADSSANRAYVSLWNTDKIVELDLKNNKVVRSISLDEGQPAASSSSAHPAALAFSVDGQHLFVALANRDQIGVVNVATGKIEGRISTRLPFQRFGGAYPVSLALNASGKTLYVANSGTNSVMVYDLAFTRSPKDSSRSIFSKATLRGAIPTEWYPVGVELHGDEMLVATAKARGIGPNNQPAVPGDARKKFRYIGGMVYGSLANIRLSDAERNLTALTAEVERANRLKDSPRRKIAFRGLRQPASPIKHVIYIIKENRTYDQVLGDLGAGNGDPSLTLYGWEISPNHHKLALQFGVLDNFYASGEISGNGHVWSTAAITSDYTEKTWQINYRGNERTYDFEGAVGNEIPLEQGIPDLDEPGTGFLWANAKRAGVTYRHYGEFVESVWCVSAGDWENSPANAAIREAKCLKKTTSPGDPLPSNVGNPPGSASPWPWEIPILVLDRAMKRELAGHFDPLYADFRTEYPDQLRTDEFLREFNQFVAARKRGDRAHELPQLIVMRLPNDHTGGTRERHPTPSASVADNDLALGRIVEAVSKSAYWNDTAILVLEDDAQDGPDHVDAHRSPALVISKYSPAPVNGKAYVESGFFTTVNMLRTLEDLLRLPPMNHNDALAAPLAALFDGKGNQQPYRADDRNLKNGLLMTINPPKARGSAASARMDFSAPDRVNAAELNQILWEDVNGDLPMPPPRHTVIPDRPGEGHER
jgi:DNA-binding beta-propeller fold protein YncE